MLTYFAEELFELLL